MNTGSNSTFRLAQAGVVGGGINDLVNVSGNLTIAGNLFVTPLAGFTGSGSYALFTYGGTLTNNGFSAINGLSGYSASIVTAIPGEVELVVSSSLAQYWDGSGTPNDGVISGGQRDLE